MNPLRDTPPEVTDKLLNWGGKNHYGESNWRIILAQNHLVQRAGMWTEFDAETDQIQFTGKDYGYETRQIAPDAIRAGMFWVPLYPCQGWVLERWFPPSAYGSREEWESSLSQDGETPMMGPYPERGGYFMLSGGGPWNEIPNLDSIRKAIAQWENSSHLHGHMDAEKLSEAVRLDCIAVEEREQEQYDAFLSEVTYAREHSLAYIKGNPSLSKFRNQLVNRSGLTSHI
jgi:hypothetical protein